MVGWKGRGTDLRSGRRKKGEPQRRRGCEQLGAARTCARRRAGRGGGGRHPAPSGGGEGGGRHPAPSSLEGSNSGLHVPRRGQGLLRWAAGQPTTGSIGSPCNSNAAPPCRSGEGSGACGARTYILPSLMWALNQSRSLISSFRSSLSAAIVISKNFSKSCDATKNKAPRRGARASEGVRHCQGEKG